MATVTAVACSDGHVRWLSIEKTGEKRLTSSIADDRNEDETNKFLRNTSLFDNVVDTTNHEFGVEGDENCSDGQSNQSTNDR